MKKQYSASLAVTTVVAAFALAVGLSSRASAEVPWPAEDLSSAVNLTSVEGPGTNDFHVNLSGVFWNPDTRRLWLCRNGGTGGSKFWVLREDGVGGFEVDTRSGLRGEWTNFGDLEAITQADYAEDVVYLMIEGEERIKEYDVSTYGTAVLRNNWNTAPHLPLSGGSGAEGIVFVPDSFLAAQNFVDGAGNPYVSQNGMGGLMFVAHQNGGRLYAFDLNRTNGTFTFVGAYKTNYGESCELTFDRSDGRLYILHGADWNRLEVTTLGSSLVSGERRLNEILTYGRPTGSPTSWNLEGFAVLSNSDCSGGTRSAFITIDDGGANSLYWFRSFPCTCDSTDDDGDGVDNCDDLCASTPAGQPVDAYGCACGQGDRTGPDISNHPTDGTVCSGGTRQFCVAASGDGTLTYQWQRNGSNISGATTTCYTASLAGTYRCIVTDTCGSATSNSATLTIATSPSISSHPSPAMICQGGSQNLCVTASGTSPISYQWQRDGVNISGATSSCYSATVAGAYRCLVTNPCSSVLSNSATLTVHAAPAIAVEPAGGAICSGNAHPLCITATGGGTLSYQWQRNGANISGATASCHDATIAGDYRCIVTSACGSATSAVATVSVSSAPSVTSHPTPATVCSGSTSQFCVSASGTGPLSYQWQRNGVNVSGATSSCYTASLAGSYRCVVSNSCGSVVSNAATLTVNSPPSITGNPLSTTVCSGNTASLCVTATGSAPLSYQWQRGGVNISGATSACYSASLAGTYRCVVSNSCGAVTSLSATLTVQSSMLWYADGDNDTFGNPAVFTSGCTPPAGYVSNNLDCNDANPNVNPGASDVCGEDRNCDGSFVAPTVWYRDLDGDGYGNPAVTTQACESSPGWVANALDCDDGSDSRHPGATEVCNGLDDDCDGTADNDDDSDGDGVSDCLDACPATAAGEPVDASGCSCSQTNPTTDTDADGVPDCSDTCPQTRPGDSVNSQGCSCLQLSNGADTDHDGVPDCLDACPDTPSHVTANAVGCSCLQLNGNGADDDRDGVTNCNDLCPFTPPGTAVTASGCSSVASNAGTGNTEVGNEVLSTTDPDAGVVGITGGAMCGAGMAAHGMLLALAFLGWEPLSRRRHRR